MSATTIGNTLDRMTAIEEGSVAPSLRRIEEAIQGAAASLAISGRVLDMTGYHERAETEVERMTRRMNLARPFKPIRGNS